MKKQNDLTVRLGSHLKSMQLTYTAYHSLALLLEKEPGNLQAQSLADLIDQKVTRGASSSPAPNVNVF